MCLHKFVKLATSSVPCKKILYGANICFSAISQPCRPGPQTRGPYVAPRAFCAARNAFWELSYNQHLSFLFYSPMLKSARTVSEQVFF